MSRQAKEFSMSGTARAAVVMLFCHLATQADAQSQSPAASAKETPFHDTVLAVYRSGEIDGAVKALNEFLASRDGQQKTAEWIRRAHDDKRRADLEAAMLLYSEATMAAWATDDVYPQRSIARFGVPLSRLRLALTEIEERSRFLRSWYLLWESFRQAHVHLPLPDELDFLDEALAAFPDDALVLLAAGSRQEMNWWVSFENAQRSPDGQAPLIMRYLLAARGYLRRSMAADSQEPEARLRLVRVLAELNDLDAAARLIAGYDWAAHGEALAYLARLFEGDLHERRGDWASAAKSYDHAMTLVTSPQSARIARAHVAHRSGLRAEAADVVLQGLARARGGDDPWWWYIRGQTWRFESYLRIARATVRR
jgi:hypothetical protein